MAKGLDELIEFLVEEIALAGRQGVSLAGIGELIKGFYGVSNGQSGSSPQNTGSDDEYPFVVDRPLLAKVWKWLGGHPDISIGRGKEYNHRSLSEVESEFPGFTPSCRLPNIDHTSSAPDFSSDKIIHPPSPDGGPVRNKSAPPFGDGPRIYAESERIHQTICGHASDAGKISTLELVLLSHIAASRSTGILQGDLVRASGQDKRSVPKRTDVLAENGYIKKEDVYVRGTRTSRLILKRFAVSNDPISASGLSGQESARPTVKDVVQQIFALLSKQALVTQTELQEQLRMNNVPETRVLSKILRRLERIGDVKRVKTAFGPSAQSGDLQNCVQLLRRPEQENTQDFDVDDIILDQPISELVESFGQDIEQDNPDMTESPESDHGANTQTKRESAGWNPDRLLSNVLHDATVLAADSGLTNADARNLITGPFVRRTLEALLLRLSQHSLLAQPAHLKHLAIIRINQVSDGVSHYVHYPLMTFRKLAKGGPRAAPGTTSGVDEALSRALQKEVSKQGSAALATQKAEMDEFGFLVSTKPIHQVQAGQASIADLVKAAKARNIVPRKGEPTIVEAPTGSYLLGEHDEMPSLLPRDPFQRTVDRRLSNEDAAEKPKGRPRKFMRGTEKFWQMQFKLASGRPSGAGMAGVMSNAVGLKLYAARPHRFDETVVEAIDAGLPIPARPQDITQDWVRATKDVLERSSDGVYITPAGTHLGRTKYTSQLVIIRTPRLDTIDFFDRKRPQQFRFISSSAAHSLPFRRYYPQLDSAKLISHQGRTHERVHRAKQVPGREHGPPTGVFYEEVISDNPRPSSQLGISVNVTNTFPAYLDSTDEDSGIAEKGLLSSRQPSRVPSEERPHRHADGREPSVSELDTMDATGLGRRRTSTPPSRRLRPARKVKLSQKAAELLELQHHPELPLSFEAAPTSTDSISARGTVSPDRQRSPQIDSSKDRIAPTFPDAQVPNDDFSRITASGATPSIVERTTRAPEGAYNLVNGVSETRVSAADHNHEDVRESPILESHAEHEAGAIVPVVPRNNEISNGDSDSDGGLHDTTEMVNENPEPPFREHRRTRQSSALSEESEYEDAGLMPRRSAKPGKPRGKLNSLCRSIILELVSEGTGVVPNDASTFRRVMAPRWQEAGEEDRPLLKAVKIAIKGLCERGKLKLIGFAFRGKGGAMRKHSILALPTIDARGQAVEELKQKIIEADPTDYIPPHWKEESIRVSLTTRRRQQSIVPLPSGSPRRLRAVPAPSTEGTDASPSPPPPTSADSAAIGFLTLKVPSRGSRPPAALRKRRTETLAPPLQFSTDASPSGTKLPSVPSTGRGGRTMRRARQNKARQVIWERSKFKDFPPSSLEDILECQRTEDPATMLRLESVDADPLVRDIDAVSAWEQRSYEAFQQTSNNWSFINHLSQSDVHVEAGQYTSVEFTVLLRFNEDGEEVETPFPPSTSWPPFVSAVAEANREEVVASRSSSPAPMRRSTRQRKRRLSTDDYDSPPWPKRPKRGKDVVRPRRGPRTRDKSLTRKSSLSKVTRGFQYLRAMPEEMIYRIVISIVCVRTLAGGLERYIDWTIVMTLFPNEDEQFVKDRWKTLSIRYRADIKGLTENLQWKYLEALRERKVPTVQFDHLASTDWPGIVDWAMKHLDKFDTRSQDTLPKTRQELVNERMFTFTEPKGMHSILSYNANATVPLKEELVSGMVFGTAAQRQHSAPVFVQPIHPPSRSEVEMADMDLCIAKSWTLATVLTSDTSYDPVTAQAKFSTLVHTHKEGEGLLSRALKSLQDDKVIQRARDKAVDKERQGAVRMWEASQNFYDRFTARRMITPSMLRKAAVYKAEVLDQAFGRGYGVTLNKELVMEDGEMVAVLNLMSMGMLRTSVGHDVPRTLYGIDWQNVGYRTREMDKKALGFSVDLLMLTGYVTGDPMQEARRVKIPRGEVDRERGRIPPWFNIHGAFQPRLWEMFVGGLIGLVSQRPGVDNNELARTLGWVLSEWEVGLVLGWLGQGGFVQKMQRGHGWETKEWWWMCLSGGVESGWVWIV